MGIAKPTGTAFWTGEIQPASINQIYRGKTGRIVEIDADTGDFAKQLKEIDPSLCLRWSEAGEYFAVYCRDEQHVEGDGYLVATYQDLDARILEDIRRIKHQNQQAGYSFADEIEKAEAAALKQFEHEQREKIGEGAEELAFALRKALGYNDHRAFIGDGIPGGKN